ncbi:MAG TPA: glycosyltransferase family 2 protein [bacterium]|nr:glycosyltransferase family 2 protein [bacterium]HPQ66516.1 glycosyltransferase family 2 protein [bacterium]
MVDISAIVTCCDNMPYIESCLRSLCWADELIVVDSGSRDRTDEVARRYAHRFFRREYTSESEQRNWAIDQATHAWIVIIDSDEVMPEALRDELLETVRDPLYGRYFVFRRGIFLGREMRYGGWNRDLNNILFRKDRYRFDGARVHARLVPEEPAGVLKNRLIHYTHRSIDEFVRKSSRYAALQAEAYARGRRGAAAARIAANPVFNFLKNYVFRRGFLDGAHGLISAVLSSCYVAEKYARLWELENSTRRFPGAPE